MCMAEIVKWSPAAVTYYRWLVFKGIIKTKDECKSAESNYVSNNNNKKTKSKKTAEPKKRGAKVSEGKSSKVLKKPSTTMKKGHYLIPTPMKRMHPKHHQSKSLKGDCPTSLEQMSRRRCPQRTCLPTMSLQLQR